MKIVYIEEIDMGKFLDYKAKLIILKRRMNEDKKNLVDIYKEYLSILFKSLIISTYSSPYSVNLEIAYLQKLDNKLGNPIPELTKLLDKVIVYGVVKVFMNLENLRKYFPFIKDRRVKRRKNSDPLKNLNNE